jgi:TfoX/Sxy family transcriptional regulator of competence genes
MVASTVKALSQLLTAAASRLEGDIAIQCKHFFSGAAAYANGRIFMTMTTVGTALKLPRESHAELIRRGARPLRYFPQGPVKKDYLVLPDSLVDDADALARWIVKSARFCQSLPDPKPRSKPRARLAK